jgi:hypothetical protein
MEKLEIKNIVKNTIAYFQYLRCGVAYYSIWDEGGNMYTFPVEISDLGNATIKNEEKGLTMMRYIRKAIESGAITCEKIQF